MNSTSRMATLWGILFPVLALVVISVILSFTGRGTAPAAVTANQASSSQSAAQGNSTTTGTPPAATVSKAPAAGSAAPATAATSGAAGTGTASTGMAGAAATGAGAAAASGSAASGTPPAGTATQAADGAQVFSSNCASCHGQAGAGVPGAFPPLAGNPAILGSDVYVSDVLLYGLQGQIAVKGQTYNGVMPPWAATLSDAQIAAVLTHIRSSWGNSAPAVSAATVKTERGTPKTSAQILAERPQ